MLSGERVYRPQKRADKPMPYHGTDYPSEAECETVNLYSPIHGCPRCDPKRYATDHARRRNDRK